jgi:hypothetical protein
MRTWNLGSGDPLCLTLSADSRCCQPDYVNDQIWEISFGGGDPPALALQTTFGLRARWMRLFPRFIQKNDVISDPAKFHTHPIIQSIHSNYISIKFSLFSGVEAILDYWVPTSQLVTGRILLTNHGNLSASFRLEWVGLLSSLGSGQGLSTESIGGTNVLAGKTSDLSPVCFMTGNPQAAIGPYAGLAVDLEIPPDTSRQFTWALASLPEIEASYELARTTTARPWDAEIARLEILDDSQMLEIYTGDPDWDAALALSQKTAYSLFFPSSKHLPFASFTLSRQPDQGFSPRLDGSDYPYLWNGQTALDAYYLINQILPGGVDLAEGILRNFLSVQDENGFIDWKPGLAGQTGRCLAQPLLGTMAWQIDQYRAKHDWLVEIYPALLKFLECWFKPEHDRNGDGFPEWDNPQQSGLEESPIYDRWNKQSQGVDITFLESPALAAFLYRECQSLIKISKQIHQEDAVPWLQEKMDILYKKVEDCWDAKAKLYHYQDIQLHHSPSGTPLITFNGSGTYPIKKDLNFPRRLLIQLSVQDETTHPLLITIQGRHDNREQVEEIPLRRFYLINGIGRSTTYKLFDSVEKIIAQGLVKGDQGKISAIDYTKEDISLLLPLWAGMPNTQQIAKIVDQTITKRFLQKYGLPISPPDEWKNGSGALSCLSLPWNLLVAEGLLQNGKCKLATELFSRWMQAIVPTLKRSHAFYERYNIENGQPSGERSHLGGLPPIGLFLRLSGVQKITNNEIILYGNNQFPWPVTVKYRGLTATCHASDTVVTFTSGQTITVNGPAPQRVSLEDSKIVEERRPK